MSSSVGYPQGRLGRVRSVRFSIRTTKTQRPALGAPLRRPPLVKCLLRGRLLSWRSLIFKHRGCARGWLRLSFVVGFLVGFLRVALASFLRLGRLFSGLGRLFSGLGCVGWVVFFRIFVSWLVPAPLVLARSPRRLPWFVRSGGPACSVGSRWRCRVSPCRLAFARRSASPPLARALPPGSAAILVARGGWAGRSPRLALLRSVCRSARVACLPRAFSFPSSRSRRAWDPPLGFCVC